MNNNVVRLPTKFASRSVDPERDFIFPASDNRGHSEKLQVKVMPSVALQIQLLVDSRRFPWTNTSDFLRHAIMLLLAKIQREYPGWEPVPGLFRQIQAVSHIKRLAQVRADVRKMFADLDIEVEELKALAYWDLLRETLESQLALLEELPPGEWRDGALRQFREKYGKLLEEVNGSEG